MRAHYIAIGQCSTIQVNMISEIYNIYSGMVALTREKCGSKVSVR